MAWAERAGQKAGANGSTAGPASVAMPGATTVGDLIKVAIHAEGTSATVPTIATPTDTQGNPYTLIDTITWTDGGLGQRMSTFWAPVNTAGTPTVSSTLTNAGSWGIGIDEHSGLATSAAVDVHTIATGTNGTPSSGNTGNTTAANELVWGAYTDSGYLFTVVAGTGFTLFANDSNNGVSQTATEDKDSGASGNPQSATTAAVTATWGMAVAVFKLAGAGVASDVPNPNIAATRPTTINRRAMASGLLTQPARDSVSAPVTTTGREEPDFLLKPNPRQGPRGCVVNSLSNHPLSAPVTSSGWEQTDFYERPNPNLGPRGRARNTDATDVVSAPVTSTGREQTDFSLKANPRLGPRGRVVNHEAVPPSAPTTTTIQAETSFVLRANSRLGPRGQVFNSAAMDGAAIPAIVEGLAFFVSPNPRVGPRGRTFSTNAATDSTSAPITASALEQTDFALKANPRLGPRGLALNTPATDTASAPVTSSSLEQTDFFIRPNPRLGPRGQVFNSSSVDASTAIVVIEGLAFAISPNPRLGPRGHLFNTDATDSTSAAATFSALEATDFVLRPRTQTRTNAGSLYWQPAVDDTIVTPPQSGGGGGLYGGWPIPLVVTTTPAHLASPVWLRIAVVQRRATVVARGTVDSSIYAEDLALLGLTEDDLGLA